MTKSFEEFEVYKKGILLAQLIFKLMENQAFQRELKFCNQSEIQKSYDLSIEISQNLSNFIKYLTGKIECNQKASLNS